MVTGSAPQSQWNYRNRKQQVGGGGGFAIWSELVHFLKTVQFYKTVHYTVHCLKTGKFTVITFVWKCLHNIHNCSQHCLKTENCPLHLMIPTHCLKTWDLYIDIVYCLRMIPVTLSENWDAHCLKPILYTVWKVITVWKLSSTYYHLHCLQVKTVLSTLSEKNYAKMAEIILFARLQTNFDFPHFPYSNLSFPLKIQLLQPTFKLKNYRSTLLEE